MTTWTPDLIEQVRIEAATGATSDQIAAKLGVSTNSLRNIGHQHKIRFLGTTGQAKRERRASQPAPIPADIVDSDRVVIAAKLDLERQIAIAKAEADTAPLYRGGWPP